jgi:hypothetical protein
VVLGFFLWQAQVFIPILPCCGHPAAAIRRNFSPHALRSHFKYDVVLPRVLYHLQPEIVFWTYFGDRRMINLQGFDLLLEIGCVSPDPDDLANP